MPMRYWYHCQCCEYRAYRYRNVKRCPDCGGELVREDPSQQTGEGAEHSEAPTVSAATWRG
jgi:rRNA maturation endonuclease Nob1